MADRGVIIGMTFGELGFFVALVMIILMASKNPNQVENLENTNRSLLAREDSLQTELVEVRIQLERLEVEKKEKEKAMRSKAPPRCQDVGIITGELFICTVIDLDRYVIDGDTLTYQAIKNRFRLELRSAKDADCIHVIHARHERNVQGVRWLRQLESDFFVKRIEIKG